jgi:hypothetical protein
MRDNFTLIGRTNVNSNRDLFEFIERRKAQRRLTKASDTAMRHLHQTDPGQSQITSFWIGLLEKLELTVNSLHQIDLTGSVSPFGQGIVRVSVNNKLLLPVHSWTDMVRDGNRIRCSVLNGGIYYLDFVLISDTEIALQDTQTNSHSMDPEKAAIYVIERMVNVIEHALN